MNYVSFKTRWNFQYILKKFSVKKGTLPLRWVSISNPGPLGCRLNALSSELQRFDRKSKGPGFDIDIQQSGSVPFFTEIFFKIYRKLHLVLNDP